MERKMLRYGQVGGTIEAFIGGVHRKAIAIDEQAQLVAGCFSASNEERNRACGEHYGLAPDRIYPDYAAMAKAEGERTTDRLDFVVISTPNKYHFEACKAFIEQGFHIACEKPLCFTMDEALELQRLVAEHHVLFCVTYTYTGYNMVKQAKELVENGTIGRIIDVKAEYLQDWLIGEVSPEKNTNTSLSVWRMNPEVGGCTCSVGDIGTHVEQTVSYIIGAKVRRLAAVLDTFGHAVDLNANMLVEFDNGVHGSFSCSQVAAGRSNGFVIRVFGTNGSIEWNQEHPDFLKVAVKGQPMQIYTRGSNATPYAMSLNRIPYGHPEGLTMAFANIYRNFTNAVLRRVNGQPDEGKWCLDFPSVEDGVMGMKFIYACVKSNSQGGCWVEM